MIKQSNTFLILASGKPKTIRRNGEKIIGKPFVYSKHMCEDLWEMGIGFMSRKEGRSARWGLMSPAKLIQCWRAMRLFERLGEVDENYNLAKCHESAEKSTEMPSNEVLEKMITMCAVHKVFVHVDELVEEGLKYKVQYTAVINKYIQEYSQALKDYDILKDAIEHRMFINSATKEYKIIRNYPSEVGEDNAAFWRLIDWGGFFERRRKAQEYRNKGYKVKLSGDNVYALVGEVEYQKASKGISSLRMC